MEGLQPCAKNQQKASIPCDPAYNFKLVKKAHHLIPVSISSLIDQVRLKQNDRPFWLQVKAAQDFGHINDV